MRKPLPWLIGLAFVLIMCRCGDEYYGDEGAGDAPDKFSVAEARDYFENTAEDLRGIAFGAGHSHSLTKSSAPANAEEGPVLTVQWAKARQTDADEHYVTLEVPLTGQGPARQAAVSEPRSRKPSSYRTAGISKLVVKKDLKTGDPFYFIATFIPDSACYAKRKDNMGNYRFMKDADYSGLIVISSEKGEFITAILRKDGQQQHVKMARGAARSTADTAGCSPVLMRLGLDEEVSAILLRANNTEEDPGNMSFTCSGCGTRYDYATLCSKCYPVEVNPDPKPPKTCSNPTCPYGGYCNGLCGGGGSGSGGGGSTGGGGGGGGGDIPPDLPVIGMNIDVLKKDKFVPYSLLGDCLKTAHHTMISYGRANNYGSSAHVYQYMWATNGVLGHYDSDYMAAHDRINKCILRHLKVGWPIIVGVDYKNAKYNEGTTDHWILVTGYGYDGGTSYYYTYIETGTDDPDVGINNRTNRLYWDLGKGIWRNSSAYDGKIYTLTQVRPNDGLYLEETIPQPANPNKK